MSLIYLDSTIWISYFLEDDKRHKDAKSFVNKITAQDDVILYSHLTLLELHEVIRKRIIEWENFTGVDISVKQKLKSKADVIISEVDKTFIALSKRGKMRLATPNKKLSDYLIDTLTIFKPVFPDLGSKNWCFVCEQNTAIRYKVVGIGHYDLQHAINSKEFVADEIVSYDGGFNQLKTIEDFKKIKVTIRT